jgi:hypothetical protein
MRSTNAKKRNKQVPKLRVKNEPPTLAEAMMAAGGMSDDPGQQVEIAATLLGLSLDPATIKALSAAKPKGNVVDINVRGRPQRPVVVEKKRVVRPLTRPAEVTPRALSGQLRLSRI